MDTNETRRSLQKLKTGIPGFDFIAEGGLPSGRTCLVTGTSGSGKTVFGAQFLAEGITQFDENGIFVTFEEAPLEIRSNMYGFGWDIDAWEEAGKWCFVDASPDPDEEALVAGDYDLDALITRILYAIETVGAKRVVLDSVGAIFGQFQDAATVRRELFRVASALRRTDVTAIITAEREEEYGNIARFGVEQFVSDNVVILRNTLEETKRRRTMEILKFRGTSHSKGEFPFSVLPYKGIVAIPLSGIELKQASFDARRTCGNNKLDEMCGGGFFGDSIILVSGATGTGKTLMTSEFLTGAQQEGHKGMLFAFEEGYNQLMRNAKGWGIDLRSIEESGDLKIICRYPEVAGLEDHLIRIKNEIDAFKPDRIAIDSLSALERVATVKGFREFVVGLTSFLKDRGIMSLFTATTPTLLGGTSATEAHISTITDAIVLLRYVELYGEMHRGITVLKMRGSNHDKQIRSFIVNDEGMQIGEPFEHIVGVLSGQIHVVGGNRSFSMDGQGVDGHGVDGHGGLDGELHADGVLQKSKP